MNNEKEVKQPTPLIRKGDKTAVNKGGRPKVEIDKMLFEKLCQVQCTQAEISSRLGVAEKTLAQWVRRTYDGKKYQDVARQFKESGLANLRCIQWKQAKKSPSMSRWLGIQYLGQEEKPSGDVSKVVIVHDDIEQKMMQELNNGDD